MNIKVLDHGYVKFVEAWGAGLAENLNSFGDVDYEAGIVEAARQSTQGSFRGWNRPACNCGRYIEDTEHDQTCASREHAGDAKLLKHLFTADPKHATPFEFSGMVIEVQAPIFVFREWHRHRTQSYNEASARYAPLPDDYYLPDFENVVERSVDAELASNKQQASLQAFDVHRADEWRREVADLYAKAERLYQVGLAVGIPKELARIVMPVGHYSRMRACANLRNWLAFLTLRLDEKAQWEIRQYAQAVEEIVSIHFPQTYRLFKAEVEKHG